MFLVKRILKHASDSDTTLIDSILKKIARGFVIDHHELFPEGVVNGGEKTDDEYMDGMRN